MPSLSTVPVKTEKSCIPGDVAISLKEVYVAKIKGGTTLHTIVVDVVVLDGLLIG